MWILDHLSPFQNSHPLVTQRIRQQNPENLAITVITFEEKVKGWLNVINKYNNQASKYEKLIWGYKGLWDEIEYFKNIKLLEFDTKFQPTLSKIPCQVSLFRLIKPCKLFLISLLYKP